MFKEIFSLPTQFLIIFLGIIVLELSRRGKIPRPTARNGMATAVLLVIFLGYLIASMVYPFVTEGPTRQNLSLTASSLVFALGVYIRAKRKQSK